MGLLVGLQREWSEPGVAGIRTFAVITFFGTVCAHLEQFGGWILAGGLVALGAMMVVINLRRVSAQDIHAGSTPSSAPTPNISRAAISGLTDMDAITLSTAQMISAGRIAVDTGWRMMLIGSLSNILFKGVVIAVLGPRQLLARIVLLLGLSLAGGYLILWLWPAVGN